MINDLTIKLEEPTDSRQLLHLIDMDAYFGNDLHTMPLDEAMMMNYAYGVSNTKNFDEFCDTMHTCLYWMNKKYLNLCQIDKPSKAINLANEIERGEEIDDEAFRYDMLFGAWLSFTMRDSFKLRSDFLNELSDMAEDGFASKLLDVSDNLMLIETFCLHWIKKMIDPHRAASYGHYMMYFMTKIINIKSEREEDIAIMNQVMTDLCIFTQSASKLCGMDEHNMPLN